MSFQSSKLHEIKKKVPIKTFCRKWESFLQSYFIATSNVPHFST